MAGTQRRWGLGFVAALGATGLVGTGGTVLGIGLLAAAAWWWGWLAGPQVPIVRVDPVDIDAGRAAELREAVELLGGDPDAVQARAAIQRELDGHAAKIGAACDVEGHGAGTLLLTRQGRVAHAWLDPGGLGNPACVERHLGGLHLKARASDPARVRFALVLPPR